MPSNAELATLITAHHTAITAQFSAQNIRLEDVADRLGRVEGGLAHIDRDNTRLRDDILRLAQHMGSPSVAATGQLPLPGTETPSAEFGPPKGNVRWGQVWLFGTGVVAMYLVFTKGHDLLVDMVKALKP